MSYLKQLREVKQILDVNKSIESIPGLSEFFHNQQFTVEGGSATVAKRSSSKYSLESWENLTYETNTGETLTIPSVIKEFKEFVEKEQKTKVIDIYEWVKNCKFNPSLNKDTVYTVAGDTYSNLECKYMIPFATWSVEEVSRIGPILYIYDIHYMAVVYCDEESRFYGKVAIFMIRDKEDFNNFSLKDAWGFLKWFQPKFSYDGNKMIRDAKTNWSALKEIFGKIKDKIKNLLKPKKEVDVESEEGKEILAKMGK